MGLGIILGAMSAAGNSAAQSIDQQQKVSDEQRLMDQRAELEERKAKAIAQFQNDLANAPANRAGDYIKQALQQATPAAFPSAPSVGAQPADTPQESGLVLNTSMPASISPAGTWSDINASAAATQPARNAAQLAILKGEREGESDPANIAALDRDIARVSKTVPADLAAATSGSSVPMASNASGGLASDPSKQDMLMAAMQKALAAGDMQAVAVLKAAIPEKTLKLGDGETLLDANTHKVIYQNTGKSDRQEKELDAKEKMKWLELDPMGLNPSNPLKGRIDGQGKGASLQGLTGKDLLAALPAPAAEQVKGLAEGRLAFPSGAGMRSPYWQSMVSLVSQYDPSFDAVNFGARAATRKDFTSGKEASSINALNTVMGHLDSLGKAAEALNNSNFPAYNTVANYVLNNTGDPRVKQFDATKKAVVDELTKAWRGTGGSEGDIKTWMSTLDDANSPKQLYGVIGQMGELLESKINALSDQYSKGMGTTSQGLSLMSPHAKETLLNIKKRAGLGESDTPAAPAPTPAQDLGRPIFAGASDLQTAIAAGKIKSGDTFADPAGNLHVVN